MSTITNKINQQEIFKVKKQLPTYYSRIDYGTSKLSHFYIKDDTFFSIYVHEVDSNFFLKPVNSAFYF